MEKIKVTLTRKFILELSEEHKAKIRDYFETYSEYELREGDVREYLEEDFDASAHFMEEEGTELDPVWEIEDA